MEVCTMTDVDTDIPVEAKTDHDKYMDDLRKAIEDHARVSLWRKVRIHQLERMLDKIVGWALQHPDAVAGDDDGEKLLGYVRELALLMPAKEYGHE